MNEAYELARNEYKQLLSEYAAALSAKDPGVVDLFERARISWEHLRLSAPEDALEAGAEPEMHLVLAFSYAVGAGDSVEAERVYNLMSDDARRNTDAVDADDPGSVRIWLRRSQAW
jgi:hypothetical protein